MQQVHHPISTVFTIFTFFFVLSAVSPGCDIANKLEDRIDESLSGDPAEDPAAGPLGDEGDQGGVAGFGQDDGGAPAVDMPQAPNPDISVDLALQIRSLAVGGNLYVEANFNWAARGGPGLIVDIQVKSSLTFPEWTDVLTDLDAVDVATWSVPGPKQTFHFRAVAQDPADPDNTYVSEIITIQ